MNIDNIYCMDCLEGMRQMESGSVSLVYHDGRRETETFADIVEMARLYILTDCGGSFERFAEWGLIIPQAKEQVSHQ